MAVCGHPLAATGRTGLSRRLGGSDGGSDQNGHALDGLVTALENVNEREEGVRHVLVVVGGDADCGVAQALRVGEALRRAAGRTPPSRRPPVPT